jgi:hypothetical protein
MNAPSNIGLRLMTVTITALTLAPFVGRAEPTTAKEIRSSFHQQGFKTDLSDFDFTVPKEMSDRAAALTNKGPVNMLQPVSFLINADLLMPAGDHTAVVVWKQATLAYPLGFRTYSYLYNTNWYKADADKDVWPLERDVLEDSAPQMDAAAAALLSGSFGFNLNAAHGRYMLLPHVAEVRRCSEIFAGRTIMALHDRDQDAAWTNLLALTRLVTGWRIEPTEVSESVRFGCLQTAYNVTWQTLQAGNWTDTRLAQLQSEWESLDVLKPLPDTVAFMGASCIADVERADYAGIVEDEKALLLFYHDREVEMRRAIQSQSWTDMQRIPDITNIFFLFPPATNLPPRERWQVESRRFPVQLNSGGLSLAGRAAEAEARRRLIITAIALERFHLHDGSYPKTLDALAPDWLKAVPLDFMNGQPLHYSLGRDGHFLLYSVGLDCKDDGGKLAAALDEAPPSGELLQHDPDIVWPLPAPTAMANARAAESGKRLQDALDAVTKGIKDAEAEREANRQATIKELLRNTKYKKTMWSGRGVGREEPLYQGQSLPKLLGNEKLSDAKQLSLDALLTLRPAISSRGFPFMAFEVPILYDRLGNMNRVHLSILMDSPPDDSFENELTFNFCDRATNGDCLLVWNSAFEPLGLHAMQALLTIETSVDHELYVKGPVLPFLSTNLLRFDAEAGPFSDRGATLYAQLAESNATFRIEMKTTAGKHLKTLTGSTTNGVIDLEWDLLDDQGNTITNHSFDSYFTVSFPGSGRSQTLDQWQSKIGTRGD